MTGLTGLGAFAAVGGDFDVKGLKVWLEGWQMASPCGVRNWDDEPFDYSAGCLHNCVVTPSDIHLGECDDHGFRASGTVLRLLGRQVATMQSW